MKIDLDAMKQKLDQYDQLVGFDDILGPGAADRIKKRALELGQKMHDKHNVESYDSAMRGIETE